MTTLIFVHIPKTAGSSLKAILDREYCDEEVYSLYGYGNSIPEAAKRLAQLPDGEKRQLKLIRGHYRFGLHSLLPQSCRYISLLRDPVERVLSHYSYAISHAEHPLHDVVKEGMGVADYAASGLSREVDNGQLRLLSGREKEIPFGECSQELLEEAKVLIDTHYALVGTLERFDESVLLMQERFGWVDVRYERRNVAEGRLRQTELSADDLSAIRSRNALDLALFQHVDDLLSRQIAASAGFEGRLTEFRHRNRVLQRQQARGRMRQHRVLRLKQAVRRLLPG